MGVRRELCVRKDSVVIGRLNLLKHALEDEFVKPSSTYFDIHNLACACP